MRRSLPLSILALIISVTSLSTAPSIVGSRVPDFLLEDQYERQWNSSKFRGTVTVYVLSDRSGYEYSPNWTKALIPRYRNVAVRFIPVADVQTVPGFLKGYIRGKFREEFKYSVLMDWDGVLVKAFGMKEGYTNLIIVNKQGIVQHVAYGTGTASQIEAFAGRLDLVLASSAK